jgi:hypothetical protein
MGVVDLGRSADGAEVALKRLTLHGSADEIARARQRVRREARVLARLRHPNIVPLLELLDDGRELTLVMPYLTGGTLADRVAQHGPAPAHEVLRLAQDLGGALAAAHRAGVIHRDLKPGNVLFDQAGVAHLADFGAASSYDDTAGLTAAGTVVGTPSFMAPEQARGEAAGTAADVFSLGATLLFAATGDGPYGRGSPDLLMMRAAHDKVLPAPRSLAPELRHLLEAMLDPRPERRPSAAALTGGHDGTVVRSPVAGRRRRRWPWWVALTTLVVGAGASAVAVAARETGSPDTPATSTPATDCIGRTYQPCGQASPSPNTDGEQCLADFADYDGDLVNGCEAEPDGLADDTPLRREITGTIVPADDIDTFVTDVGDGSQLFCDGRFTVTLTAPAGVTLRLEVLDPDGRLLGKTTSADGVPSSVVLEDPGCLSNDSTTLTSRVSPIGSDRTGDRYHLATTGSF